MAVQVCNNVVASSEGRELAQHGSPMFPIACYAEDMTADSVAWHWHEEFEYILSEKGILYVDVNKTRVRLNQGEGIFVNSGALHAVEQSPALLHSSVFHPRLVGGMDTIFWQKLIKPMTQPELRRSSSSMRRCPGRKRCWPACGMPGGRWPMSPLIMRTGRGIISRRRCGSSAPSAWAARPKSPSRSRSRPSG